jgi:hypothetical protein
MSDKTTSYYLKDLGYGELGCVTLMNDRGVDKDEVLDIYEKVILDLQNNNSLDKFFRQSLISTMRQKRAYVRKINLTDINCFSCNRVISAVSGKEHKKRVQCPSCRSKIKLGGIGKDIEIVCQYCKKLKVVKANPNGKERKFCSRECYVKGRFSKKEKSNMSNHINTIQPVNTTATCAQKQSYSIDPITDSILRVGQKLKIERKKIKDSINAPDIKTAGQNNKLAPKDTKLAHDKKLLTIIQKVLDTLNSSQDINRYKLLVTKIEQWVFKDGTKFAKSAYSKEEAIKAYGEKYKDEAIKAYAERQLQE